MPKTQKSPLCFCGETTEYKPVVCNECARNYRKIRFEYKGLGMIVISEKELEGSCQNRGYLKLRFFQSFFPLS
jgi:hypothetical protein